MVTILVHDNNETPVAGATVSGAWSNGASGGGSCVTDAAGTCSISVGGTPKRMSTVRFTVTDVTHGTLGFNGNANHDPDGDSDGTAIVIAKP